jgi:hypothetical protein
MAIPGRQKPKAGSVTGAIRRRGHSAGVGARVPQPVIYLDQSPQAPDKLFIRRGARRLAQVFA